ncbi:phytanoyl-CoA dioxygenase family protein [Myxococcota bacterium]|nr:phytanoyl-CoA dioxygenase family protein [Myxococcota bacterium]
MDARLTGEERRRYSEEGFFFRASVFRDHELDPLREAAERVVALAEDAARKASQRDAYLVDGNRYVEVEGATVQFEHRAGSQTIRVIEPFHHLDPALDRLLGDPRIVAPVCDVLDVEQVALWTDKLNLKRPREGSGFRWHQDSPYWAHACGHCDRLPNVMITLDDADRDNGCFRLVPGSHARGFLPGLSDGTRLGPLFTDPKQFDEGRQWLAEIPGGSLVFFDAHIVHGSEPNTSDRARRAFVVTYQPPGFPMFKLEGARNFAP